MPDTLERDLERYFGALADRLDDAPRPTSTPDEAIAQGRRWGRTGLAAALVLLVAGAVALVAWPRDQDPDVGPVLTDPSAPPTDATDTPDDPPAGGTPAWSPVSGAGLDIVEYSPRAVWMTTDFFVLYAENLGSDPIGARIDPVTGEARPLPPPPIHWRDEPTVVWAGREVVVLGGSSGVERTPIGAAYDPVADTWREIHLPPALARDDQGPLLGSGAWTGSRVAFPLDGLTYDPASDEWTQVPTPPLSPRTGAATVAIGEDIVVWGGCEPVLDCYQHPDSWLEDGALYDASTGTWTLLPDGPLDAAPFAVGVSDGRGATIVALHLESDGAGADVAARFDPDAGWVDLPEPDGVPWFGSALAQAGDAVVLMGPAHGASHHLVLLPGADGWAPIPAPASARRFHVLVDGGDHLLVAGGAAGGPPELLALADAWPAPTAP